MSFISLNKVEAPRYNEDTGTEVETSKPCVINAEAIRCFYPRSGGKIGTRLTFTDGGGFAVVEEAHEVARALGRTDLVELLRPTAEVVSITDAVN